jgi:hypothetical protein
MSASSTVLNAAFAPVIPDSLKFGQPKRGPSGTRKEIRLPAVATSYATNSDSIVRFFFSSDGILDFRRGYLSFDLTVNCSTPYTYLRVSQGIWSIFNRLRLVATKELEDIREYNLYNSCLFESLRDEDIADVIGPSCYGFATQAERNSFSSTTKTYSMPVLCGFFLTGAVPMKLLKQRLELQLYLEQVSRCIETDANIADVSYTLTNIYFHTEELALDPAVLGELQSLMGSGISYPYKRFVHYVQPVINSRSNLVIPHVGSGIEALLHVFRNSNSLSNPLLNDKLLTYSRINVEDHQLRINNDLYPPEKTLANTPQSYIQYLRYIGKWTLSGVYRNPPAIGLDEYNSNRFIIVNHLETYPNEGLVNGLSTEAAGTNMYLQLSTTVAPPAGTQMDTFVQSHGVITFVDGKLC